MHLFTDTQFITNPSSAIGKLYKLALPHRNILSRICGAVPDTRSTSQLTTGNFISHRHSRKLQYTIYRTKALYLIWISQNWNRRSFWHIKHAYKRFQTDYSRSGEIHWSIHEQHHSTFKCMVGRWLSHVVLRCWTQEKVRNEEKVLSTTQKLPMNRNSWLKTYNFSRHQQEWNQVSNNVKPGGNFVVLDLDPASWYHLRVTAHNNAGFAVAEYEFATLTVTGGEYRSIRRNGVS